MTETYDSFSDFYKAGCYARFPQEHRRGGSFGVQMLEASQEAGEFVDPPIDEVSFVEVVAPPDWCRLDFATGRRELSSATARGIGPQPPNVECHFAMDSAHSIRSMYVKTAVFIPVLESADLSLGLLEPLYATFLTEPLACVAFRRLWNLMRDDAPETSLAVDGAFLTFLAHYLGAGRSAAPVRSRGHGMESVRLRRVIDYIEAHLGSQLLMVDLADVAAYSVSHFARTFRDTFGMTAHRYVTARRIERAKEALTRTSLPIAVIALDCGFGSSAAFATAFRRNVGLTPTDYRARAA